MNIPILEFDPSPEAILNPHQAEPGAAVPERAVLCFFKEVLDELAEQGELRKIASLGSEMGRNPLYELDWQGRKLLVFHPGVGAPLAIGFVEEAIALGAKKFIACGGCGVLNPEIVAGHPVVLTQAIRDEGTSYHHLPPGAEASASPEAVSVLCQVMDEHHLPYLLGKSWTTDGLYRETIAKRELRVAQGCEVVEMEAAAFFAVAQFRKIVFGQLVYGGDLVIPEGWDFRDWYKRKNDRQRLFWLAVEACARL